MYVLTDLDQLAELVDRIGERAEPYLRWSQGPAVDLAGRRVDEQSSRDALTGVTLPGLSANSLRVEPWWGDRSTRLWVARRLYDYCHLRHAREPGASPWVFTGEQCGRGPDNEPLAVCHQPIAWVSEQALREAEIAIEEQSSDEWGPLHRAN